MSDSLILLLDLPAFSSRSLQRALERAGYEVRQTAELDVALATLRAESVRAALCHPDLGGEDLCRAALELPLPPPLFLFDDFGALAETPAFLRDAVFETIVRPADEDETVAAVRRAIDGHRLEQENRRLRGEVQERFQLGNLISSDVRMAQVFETIEAVADSRAGILIQGESGTGKTVLARAVHELSGQPTSPFVVVNCGALPSSLLESELFGHVRGAFTGAVRDREGKFESADGGTILLDEIATAPHELQVKLLRVIEEGRFERVGESSTRLVDVRVIAATNQDLEEEVALGTFRADLFYRINIVRIDVPPLRDRPGDVPLLVERFITRFARRHGRDVRDVDPAAISRLCSHPWPGNVRELENTIERAVLLARGPLLRRRDLWPGEDEDPVEAEHAGESRAFEELPLGPLKRALEIPERWLILRALRHSLGSRQETARILGINRTTLFNKMRKYNLLSFPAKMEGEYRDGEHPLDQAG